MLWDSNSKVVKIIFLRRAQNSRSFLSTPGKILCLLSVFIRRLNSEECRTKSASVCYLSLYFVPSPNFAIPRTYLVKYDFATNEAGSASNCITMTVQNGGLREAAP